MLTGTFICIIIVIIFPPNVVHYAKIRLLAVAETLYRMCFYSNFTGARMCLLQSEFRI